MGKGRRMSTIDASLAEEFVRSRNADQAKTQQHLTVPSFEGLMPDMNERLAGGASNKENVEFEMEDIENIPFFLKMTAILSYAVPLLMGYIRDCFGKIFYPEAYAAYYHSNGLAPIVEGFESLYHRYIYIPIRDCFNRPITGVAGRMVKLLDRISYDGNKTFQFTGTKSEVLNLASYNYLGFAAGKGKIIDEVESTMRGNGLVNNSPRSEVGDSDLLRDAEEVTARFVGQESSILISQGFATNSTTIPAVVSKGCLVLSDEMNHNSIVYGSRLSGAVIRVFKHNAIDQLEKMLRKAIAEGQPRTHRPWKKIFVVIEGLYSMEGSFPKLPEILALKQKYKFYIYLDEAHSIGALGPRGRGICDYYGVDPKQIDIMMGTFTKSFGAAGGYIAGKKSLIEHLKRTNFNHVYGEPLSVPVLQQVVSSIKCIMGEDGTTVGLRKLEQIAFNARYFSSELKKRGFLVCSHPDSPVIPMLLFHYFNLNRFSRECLARGVAVVVVSYPATPIFAGRVRFCMSASHSKEDLDRVLEIVDEVGTKLKLKNMK